MPKKALLTFENYISLMIYAGFVLYINTKHRKLLFNKFHVYDHHKMIYLLHQKK